MYKKSWIVSSFMSNKVWRGEFDRRMNFDLLQVQVKNVLIQYGLHKWRLSSDGGSVQSRSDSSINLKKRFFDQKKGYQNVNNLGTWKTKQVCQKGSRSDANIVFLVKGDSNFL